MSSHIESSILNRDDSRSAFGVDYSESSSIDTSTANLLHRNGYYLSEEIGDGDIELIDDIDSSRSYGRINLTS